MDPRRRTTSYDIPRVSALPRLLRLRADDKLRKMLFVPAPGEAGIVRLEVPSRENLSRAEVIRVEISLGPMADEVVLKGTVSSISARDGHSPLVVIDVDPKHVERGRYVAAVLAEERAATARRYRRVECGLSVRWRHGLFTYEDVTVDLSQGGVFVASQREPPVGAEVDLHIGLPNGREVALRSRVVWAGIRRDAHGFGAHFVDRERADVESLAAAVRTIEDGDFR